MPTITRAAPLPQHRVVRGAAPKLLQKPQWQEWKSLPNDNWARTCDRKRLYIRIIPTHLFHRHRSTWMVITGLEAPGNAAGLGSEENATAAKKAAEQWTKKTGLM